MTDQYVTEIITEIIELISNTQDVELLDFVVQLLRKSI